MCGSAQSPGGMPPGLAPAYRSLPAVGSETPAGMEDDRLEALVAADGLVGADLVEPLPLGEPAPLAELEQRGRVAGGRVGKVFEGVGIEMDADQREQPARLPVAGPEDLVVPVRVFPAEPLDRIELA